MGAFLQIACNAVNGFNQPIQGTVDFIRLISDPGQRVIGIFARHRHHQREKAITNQDHSAFVMTRYEPTTVRATRFLGHRAYLFFHQGFTPLSVEINFSRIAGGKCTPMCYPLLVLKVPTSNT